MNKSVMEAKSEDIPKWAFSPAKYLAPSAEAEPNANEKIKVFRIWFICGIQSIHMVFSFCFTFFMIQHPTAFSNISVTNWQLLVSASAICY